MSFLPEEDQEYLDGSKLAYELLTEKTPEGTERRGVFFPGLAFVGNLCVPRDGALTRCETCDLLVIVPDGYTTTKLDSFYTLPRLKRPDGSDPQNANADSPLLFGRSWQFWSRHLEDKDWRVGTDNLRTYLSYIRGELRSA